MITVTLRLPLTNTFIDIDNDIIFSGRVYKRDHHDRKNYKTAPFNQVLRCHGGIESLYYNRLRNSIEHLSDSILIKIKLPYKSSIGRDLFLICKAHKIIDLFLLVSRFADGSDELSRYISLYTVLKNDKRSENENYTDFWWDTLNDYFICLSKSNARSIMNAIRVTNTKEYTPDELREKYHYALDKTQRAKKRLERLILWQEEQITS